MSSEISSVFVQQILKFNLCFAYRQTHTHTLSQPSNRNFLCTKQIVQAFTPLCGSLFTLQIVQCVLDDNEIYTSI